jgi:uncharacterized cupredoxin-like copper-binding protein
MRQVRNTCAVFAAVLLGFGLIFYGSGRGLAQDATPVPPESVGRPAHIHAGTCDTLDPNPLFPLTNVTAPLGVPSGSPNAVQVETSFTTVAVDMATLLASDNSINVHLSAEQADVYVACGEIGGTALDAAGSLAIGLREQNDSGLTGVAFLTPNAADPAQTDVSVFLAADLAEGETEAIEEEEEGAAAGGEVDVSLTEFAIDMPTTLAAGPTTFTITNDGTIEHSFEIESEELGIEEELEQNLAPGETATLEVDLEPGTYEVYCPVGDHRGEGMEVELTVE